MPNAARHSPANAECRMPNVRGGAPIALGPNSQLDIRGVPFQFVHPGRRYRQCDIGIAISVPRMHHRHVLINFVPQHLR